jgi:hypothetical protein
VINKFPLFKRSNKHENLKLSINVLRIKQNTKLSHHGSVDLSYSHQNNIAIEFGSNN